MALVTSFYTLIRQGSTQSVEEAAVVFMTPHATEVLTVLEKLSAHAISPERRRQHLIRLEGRGRTLDGTAASRSYAQSGNGAFWQVEHVQVAPEEVPVMEAMARRSQTPPLAEPATRARLRRRS